MTIAYSYLRFSTPEQMQGDSFRRQTEAAKVYAERHGLTLEGTPPYCFGGWQLIPMLSVQGA
jgi:DNA invertase Pin-like site-specific DNA recombinase